MKALYWRPQRVSGRVLGLLTALALCGLVAVETFRVREQQPFYREKMQASHLAQRAYETIKNEKLRLGIAIDHETDPAVSGMIGVVLSATTTNTGHVGAKQTSVNPNFAALVVHLLTRAEVREGDVVAVGLSGSFPALNIAVFAAVQTLRLRALVISSSGSSQWGANNPELTWPDMEKLLFDKGLFTIRSLAASLGGLDDRALGLSAAGKKLLREAVTRSGVTLLEPKTFNESLEQRMALYRSYATEGDIRAYINVGGGTISVGTTVGKQQFKPGLTRTAPRGPLVDSVMARLASRGVPIIHLTKIEELAESYGLPIQPHRTPSVGEGKVFVKLEYNRWLAGAALFAIFAALALLIRFDLGYRLFDPGKREGDDGAPAEMV